MLGVSVNQKQTHKEVYIFILLLFDRPIHLVCASYNIQCAQGCMMIDEVKANVNFNVPLHQ